MPAETTPGADDPPPAGIIELAPTGDSTPAASNHPEAPGDGAGDEASELPLGADAKASASPRTVSRVRSGILVGVVIVMTLAGLVGWLSYRSESSNRATEQRELFLQVAKQGALNLTTIDWQQADSDVQRILDGATGTFRDDFAQRSEPFVDVVKQAKSTSVGAVTEAGLESETPGAAQVLVAVGVKTSTADGPEQDPRAWRMRISVQKVGDQAKVSNVEFVP